MAEPRTNAPRKTAKNSPKLCRIPTPLNSELFGPALYLSMALQNTHKHNSCFSLKFSTDVFDLKCQNVERGMLFAEAGHPCDITRKAHTRAHISTKDLCFRSILFHFKMRQIFCASPVGCRLHTGPLKPSFE